MRRIWDAEVVGSNPATLISNRLHNLRLMVVEDSVAAVVAEPEGEDSVVVHSVVVDSEVVDSEGETSVEEK